MTDGRGDDEAPDLPGARHGADDTESNHTVSNGTVSNDTVSNGTVTNGSGPEGTVSHGTGSHGTGDTATEGVDALVEDELAVVGRQRDEYLDMVRRVQADFENYKKRMVRQQTDLLERAAEGLVTRLLPVLDAFDLARTHLEAEDSPEGKALLQAAGLLQDTLAKEGLERVDEVGVAFDPTTHDAVDHQPLADDAAPDDESGPVVTDVLRAGYRYKGRVVRPAMVRVAG